MADVMTVESLVEVLASIEGRWPNSERRIVACVGRYPFGVEISSRWLVERFGGSRTNYDRRIRKLVEDQVLIEIEPAKGSVGRKVRVNPAIGRWRDVPWATDVASVALWAFSEGHDADLLALSKAGLVRRFVAPPKDGATNERHLRSVAPSEGGPQKKRRGPTQERATNLASALGGSPKADGQIESSPTHGEPGGGVDIDRATWAKAKTALIGAVRKTDHRAFLHDKGEPADTYRLLVATYGIDPITKLLERRPPEYQIPRTIDWLVMQLDAGAHEEADDDQAPPAGPVEYFEADDGGEMPVEDRLANLDRIHAAAEALRNRDAV